MLISRKFSYVCNAKDPVGATSRVVRWMVLNVGESGNNWICVKSWIVHFALLVDSDGSPVSAYMLDIGEDLKAPVQMQIALLWTESSVLSMYGLAEEKIMQP